MGKKLNIYKSLLEPLTPVEKDTIALVRDGNGVEFYVSNGVGTPVNYRLNVSINFDKHLANTGGDSHNTVTSSKAGFMSPAMLDKLNNPVKDTTYITHNNGSITGVKTFIAEVTSNNVGVFYVDWSSANFSQPPLHVSVTAYDTQGSPENIVTATMQGREKVTTSGGYGYTLKGFSENIEMGNESITSTSKAPSKKVTVMAWGV